MNFRTTILVGALAFAAAGCSTSRETNPGRTATEQLLISKAADEAAARLTLPVADRTNVFVDTRYFDAIDSGYAIGAIRDRLLKLGANLVAEKAGADVVVDIRSGALSIDEQKFLIGIPEFEVPIPLAGGFPFPEIALFKKDERRGVAKFAATAYGANDGRFIASSEPQFGYAHKREWTFLLFISWGRDDLIPDPQRESLFAIEPPRLP